MASDEDEPADIQSDENEDVPLDRDYHRGIGPRHPKPLWVDTDSPAPISSNVEDRVSALGPSDVTLSHPNSMWDASRLLSRENIPLLDDTTSRTNVSLGDGYVEGQFSFRELLSRLENIRDPTSLEGSEASSESLSTGDSYSLPSMQGSTALTTHTAHKGIHALDWTNFISVDEDKLVGSGGFGDVYEGKWKNLPSSEDVTRLPRIVVKRFRVTLSAMRKTKMGIRLLREIAVWHVLDHENIVPFVGILEPPRGSPGLISELLSNGSVQDYIWKVPSTCLRSIILGIARGLHYLHEFPSAAIIHGDLKAENVLINKIGHPCLCDFGLSRMLMDNTLWNTSATHTNGTTRWMAPELLPSLEVDGPNPTLATKESDVYAFAMTCYEVITGNVPFSHIESENQVLVAVMRGKKLTRPDHPGFSDDLWSLLRRCWSTNRPNTHDILENFEPECCRGTSLPDARCFYRAIGIE